MNKEELTLKDVFKEINKKYGDGTLGYAADNENTSIETWDTGSPSLNHILGNGGIAKGRIYEMYGEPSQGKSTMAMFLMAQIQKSGGKAAYIDAEMSFNDTFAESIGIDMSKLIFHQPANGEEAFDVVDELIKTNEIDIIVVDSTGTLVSKRELDTNIGDQTIALTARLMTSGLKRITQSVSRTKTIVIFISQTRVNIGAYMSPKTSTGGQAIRFYSSARLEVKIAKDGQIKKDGEIVGNRLHIKAVKNKCAVPFREAEINLLFASGIDLCTDVFDWSEAHGIITKSGNTYTFGSEKLGVGRDQSIESLRANSKIYDEVRKAIKEGECGSQKADSKKSKETKPEKGV